MKIWLRVLKNNIVGVIVLLTIIISEIFTIILFKTESWMKLYVTLFGQQEILEFGMLEFILLSIANYLLLVSILFALFLIYCAIEGAVNFIREEYEYARDELNNKEIENE